MSHQPQAFPKPYNGQPGMDLRDFFAAMAMHALLSDIDCCPEDVPSVVKSSYIMADAMMEARE
jgi:hypothetical protein